MSLARVVLCVLCLAVLGACGDDGGGDDPAWTVVTELQPSALLSVWAGGADDVWVVGGDPRRGAGPIVARYDGAGWTKLDTGQRSLDLWWVFGFSGGPIYMSGSGGAILRYQNGAFEKMTTPGGFTVFGMWGAAPNDLWAVGGNFGTNGFVWRYDGNAWTALATAPTDVGTYWKVNGRAANDVWISATNGDTFHWNGAALERVDVSVDTSLLSIAGNAERFITVGGGFDGVLFENDGSGWKSALPSGGPLLNGVAVSADDAYAVGRTGTVLRRRAGGGWAAEKSSTEENLHAAWIDPDGGAWAVGGKYETPPYKDGVLIHKGAPLQGTF